MLTYAQCDLPLRDMLEVLRDHSILTGSIRYMCLSDEDHHDTEGVHRHVFIWLTHAMQLKKEDMDQFDLVRTHWILDGEEGFKLRTLRDMKEWFEKSPELLDMCVCGKETEMPDRDEKTMWRRWHPYIGRPDDCPNSPKIMWNYTRKDNKFIEYGHIRFTDGERKKLDTVERNALLATLSIPEIISQGLVPLCQLPQLKKAKQILENELHKDDALQKVEIKWFYGKTGCGKSYTARKEAMQRSPDVKRSEAYWVLRPGTHCSSGWYDGYEGQPVAIFDDLRSNTMPWDTLLQVTDEYQDIEVPIKGGFTFWRPKLIIITSAGTPREVFRDRETGEPWDNIDQLERRIGEVRRFWRDGDGYHSEVENLQQP